MVHVVDAIMGAGKTTAAINYMNKNKESKFIYVTPYLTEVDRIMSSCKFKQPIKYTENTPKIIDLKRLLNEGESIVTTHVMFHLFDDEIIELCRAQDYILFMDEVTDVVEPYRIGKNDAKILLENYVNVLDNGLLEWKSECAEYTDDKYQEEKRLCEMGSLAIYGGEIVMWMFPVKIFNAFKDSWILTYMFNGQMQKYYYDFYNIEYDNMYVTGDSLDTYKFTEEKIIYHSKYDYKELIYILEDEKLNAIGEPTPALSKTWYTRHGEDVLMKQLRNNLINFFNNKNVLYDNVTGKLIKSISYNNIWTTFTDYQKILSGKGYAKAFIPSNMRATNEYRDRTVVAYAVNKYFNPVIKQFFIGNGIEIDEDKYATSEMLQFIWRSGIRDGKHISIYIPSSRMRYLLMEWINKMSVCEYCSRTDCPHSGKEFRNKSDICYDIMMNPERWQNSEEGYYNGRETEEA